MKVAKRKPFRKSRTGDQIHAFCFANPNRSTGLQEASTNIFLAHRLETRTTAPVPIHLCTLSKPQQENYKTQMTTSQTTPQTSPNGTPTSCRIDRKKALELKLQRKLEALANMQARIFETQMEILELQGRKEGEVVKKKKDLGSPQDTVMEVGEVVSDDTGSEWSDESLSC